eukprot:jgi/Ulvmu1/12488/UM009_0141.1
MQLHGGGFSVAWAQLMVFYYMAGVVLHCVIPRILPVHSVQEHGRGSSDVYRDSIYSLGPIAIKAAVWTACEWLHSTGWSQFYSSQQPASMLHILYMTACVLIMDYMHDAWFYWTHRLLHWRPLYRHVHYVHHKSTAPTAFTGYSFHVIEAIIVFANEIFLGLLIPIDMNLHRAYHLFTTVIHQGGHAGYEISPFLPHVANIMMCLLHGFSHGYKGFNTVKHHDMHHRHPLKHFSLYFTHWDRVCGTLHPQYESRITRYFPEKQR